MDTEKLLKKLINVAQLDIDAVYAYEEALKKINDERIFKKIDEFRNDHLRHINNISNLIRHYGGVPPEREKDFKGYLIEGFTALRGITGIGGALSAMESNEVITNKVYRESLIENELPEDVKKILEKNYEDEKRHLEYIRNAITEFDSR